MNTFVYPVLGSVLDARYFRLSGVGLGNAFFSYFHAVRAAAEHGATVITPAWMSFKSGPLLRGDRSKRLYGVLFSAHPMEISGIRKAFTLAAGASAQICLEPDRPSALEKGKVNLAIVSRFEFGLLHAQRTCVKDRLLAICRQTVAKRVSPAPYIAFHVRMGDFGSAPANELLSGNRANLRIPLNWYVAVLKRLRRVFPAMPIILCSDGSERDLVPLLHEGARMSPIVSDIDDLFLLSGAAVLVGSNSTFSRWAAFLGNMPTIWLRTDTTPEQPTSKDVAISYLDFQGEGSLNLGI